MVKQTPKMTALVVSAIRNLREVQGSTPKEILNYIASEYNATNPTNDANIQRKVSYEKNWSNLTSYVVKNNYKSNLKTS